jgi:chromate reductase, NAD(P)H dehydrogenase (quinone)
MMKKFKNMRILAISGSLRSISSNTALLHAAASLAPEGVEIHLYGGLGDLPHFNPDLEGNEPASVLDFRSQLRRSNSVLFSSPEYAHGVPGVLKNALDWVVGSGELVSKPVALFNASPRATYAQASLTETLKTMGARMVDEASRTFPLLGSGPDAASIVAHLEISNVLQAAIVAFAEAIDDLRYGDYFDR